MVSLALNGEEVWHAALLRSSSYRGTSNESTLIVEPSSFPATEFLVKNQFIGDRCE